MTVPRRVKLARRAMIAAHVPEVDYPYLFGLTGIGVFNIVAWLLLFHAAGVL